MQGGGLVRRSQVLKGDARVVEMSEAMWECYRDMARWDSKPPLLMKLLLHVGGTADVITCQAFVIRKDGVKTRPS